MVIIKAYRALKATMLKAKIEKVIIAGSSNENNFSIPERKDGKNLVLRLMHQLLMP